MGRSKEAQRASPESPRKSCHTSEGGAEPNHYDGKTGRCHGSQTRRRYSGQTGGRYGGQTGRPYGGKTGRR